MLRADLLDDAMEAHVQSLRSIDKRRAPKFEQLRGSNREGAAAEALVGACLRSWVDEVLPAEDLATGGPDFICTQQGKTFYVEVASLATSAVESASWLPDDPNWRGGAVGSISAIVRTIVSGKQRQCASRRDAPVLVAIGIHNSWMSTFVDQGLARGLLISDEAYEVPVPPQSPMPTEPGEYLTRLSNALFMAVDANGIAPKRQPISGVLVLGLGVRPPAVIGCVNRAARRPFDVDLLPPIPFAAAEVADGRVAIHWYNT